jgi:hypothetical protein
MSESDILPSSVQEKVVSLTRRSRRESNDNHLNRRDQILDKYDLEARVRDEDDTLVIYPTEWIDSNGNIDFSEVDDKNNAIEISLSGPNKDADWEEVYQYNMRIVSRVRDEFGDVHAKNIEEFGEFLANHYLKKITEATEEEKKDFMNEFFVRNVWSTDKQESVLDDSLEIVEEVTKD